MDDNAYDNSCQYCGKPGEVTQCPYRVPYSMCLCNECYYRESVAFDEFEKTHPKGLIFNFTPLYKQECMKEEMAKLDKLKAEYEKR